MTVNTPNDLLVLHAVRILGYSGSARIADRVGLPETVVEEHLLDAQAYGWVALWSSAGEGGWSVTDAGKTNGERLLAAELDAACGRGAVQSVYADFLPLNHLVAQACTAWQLATMNVGDAPATLEETIGALEQPAAALIWLEHRLTAVLPRFDGYHRRFAAALSAASAEPDWITGIDRDSAHRVWFELHEDLIATLGVTR